jgi:hypothetical protein
MDDRAGNSQPWLPLFLLDLPGMAREGLRAVMVIIIINNHNNNGSYDA